MLVTRAENSRIKGIHFILLETTSGKYALIILTYLAWILLLKTNKGRELLTQRWNNGLILMGEQGKVLTHHGAGDCGVHHHWGESLHYSHHHYSIRVPQQSQEPRHQCWVDPRGTWVMWRGSLITYLAMQRVTSLAVHLFPEIIINVSTMILWKNLHPISQNKKILRSLWQHIPETCNEGKKLINWLM